MQHAFLIVLILSSCLSVAQAKKRGAITCSVAGRTEAGELAIVCRQISSGRCYRLSGSTDTGKFAEGTNAQTLGFDGSEKFSITGLSDSIQPGQEIKLEIHGKNGESKSVAVKLRIDTPIEVDYYRHGGILAFVLRQLLAQK